MRIVAPSLLSSFILAILTPSEVHEQVVPDPDDPPPKGGGSRPTVSVSPDGGSTTVNTGSSGNAVSFTVRNNTSETESFDLSCWKGGQVTSCNPTVSSVELEGGASQSVSVTFAVSTVSGSGTVGLGANQQFVDLCDLDCPETYDSGYYNVTVSEPPPPPPPAATVDLTRYPARRVDYAMSLNANFAATYAQSTVPYYSLDVARSVTLVYNEDRTSLKPFVFADVSHGSLTPDTVKLQVKVNDAFVTFVNGDNVLHFTVGNGGPHRIGGQLDATALGTGRHAMDLIVTSVYNTPQAGYDAGTAIAVRSTDLIILDERSSPIARGWSISGLQRLYPLSEGVLIAEGDGSYTHFVGNDGTYVSPPGDLSTLYEWGGGSGYARSYTNPTTPAFHVVFNSSGQMTQIRNRFGDSTVFTYDGLGRLWKITDPQALVTELSYGMYGLAFVKDPFNRYTYISVAPGGTLNTIQDPDGVSTTFGYDGNKRLQTITDRRGETTTLSYDGESGKLASIQAPLVYVSGLGDRHPTTWFEPWHKDGVPYGDTEGSPLAAMPADSVDALMRSADSVVTRFRHLNAHGQPNFVHRPYGLVDTTYFNADGQVTDLRSSSGMRASYAYDGTGFMTQSVVDGITLNRANGGWGQPSAIWGDVTTRDLYLNSANGRVDSIRLAGNNALLHRYTYDSRGRVLVTIDPEGDSTRTWYAGTNGNRSKDSLPGGRVTTYGYDVYGRDSSVTQAGMPTRRVIYDLINRPVASYDGVNATPTQFTYESLYLASVTDPTGQVYQYVRDALGRVVGQVDPTERRDTTEYGWMGEVRRYVNRRNQAITLTYDSLLRSTVRQGTNFTADTLEYSPNGRIVTGRSETSIETEYLNPRGQPDSVKTVFRSDPSKVFWRRYGYDERARVTSVLHTGSSVFFQSRTYDWSADGTLTTLGLGGNNTTFGYNNDLARQVTTLPGTNHTITRGFSTVHATINLQSAAMSEYYHSDVGLRVDQASGSSGTEFYDYDGLGRLEEIQFRSGCILNGLADPDHGWVCASSTLDSTRSLAYDQVGNRTDNGGTYDTGNRITAFAGCSYDTDDDGNVTSRSCGGLPVTFTWNALNQLTGYTVNGATVNLRYDAFGRLVRQWGTPVTENFYLWDRGHLYATLNSAFNLAMAQYSYYPGTDQPHALVVNSTQYFAHQDGLGNVKALTTSDKTVQRTYEYDEWGRLKGGTNNIPQADRDRVRFKGALWFGDAGVELYYMRNRWYEPKTGRFLSEDPIGLAGGINPYVFGRSDPINRRDPTGLESCEKAGDHWHVTEYRTNGELDSAKIEVHMGCEENPATQKALARGLAVTLGYYSDLGIPVNIKTPAGEWALHLGLAGDAVVPLFWGFTGAGGGFVDRSGLGFYTRVGFGVGADISLAVEYGLMKGSGWGGQIQGGAGIFSVTGSNSGGSFAVGIGIPGGHIAVTYTSKHYLIRWRR